MIKVKRLPDQRIKLDFFKYQQVTWYSRKKCLYREQHIASEKKYLSDNRIFTLTVITRFCAMLNILKPKTHEPSIYSHSPCFFFFFVKFLCIALAALEEQHNNSVNGTDKSDLSPKQKHQMKHRELFLSRQVETLAATQIRGKCAVTLLNEEESLLSYLNKDVSLLYCLKFLHTKTFWLPVMLRAQR